MIPLIAAVFVASLVGSLHCAGMCGGVVALCVGVEGAGARGGWRLHAAYNGGRGLTYALLGAASGGLGAAIDLGGDVLGLQRLAAALAGVTMIIIGVVAVLRVRGVKLRCLTLPPALRQVFQRGFRLAQDRPPVARALLVGLLTGFLPCGWLYAFVITAAGTGSAAAGALTMIVFWTGTLPVMIGVGVGLQTLAGPLRRHIPTVTAATLVIVGAVTVFGRLAMPAYADAALAAAASSDPAAAPVPDQPPCHDEP